MHPDRPPLEPSEPPDVAVRLTFASTPISIRAALQQARQQLAELGLSHDERDTVELVLAEVMNNVCEHAYRGSAEGVIELHMQRDGAGLLCQVLDEGLPMPGGGPPSRSTADVERPLHELPEGGFGWFLIRELTSDLVYERTDGRNRLAFRLRLGTPSATAPSALG